MLKNTIQLYTTYWILIIYSYVKKIRSIFYKFCLLHNKQEYNLQDAQVFFFLQTQPVEI